MTRNMAISADLTIYIFTEFSLTHCLTQVRKSPLAKSSIKYSLQWLTRHKPIKQLGLASKYWLQFFTELNRPITIFLTQVYKLTILNLLWAQAYHNLPKTIAEFNGRPRPISVSYELDYKLYGFYLTLDQTYFIKIEHFFKRAFSPN